MPEAFEFAVPVRYFEYDQQGVAFNGWYLMWFDDAMTARLAHGGLGYPEMVAAGYDLQLVHTEVDWRGAVRYGDAPRVAVAPVGYGRTSLTLDFEVRVDGAGRVWARTVYVVVAADGSGAREVPALVRDALGDPAPLRPTRFP